MTQQPGFLPLRSAVCAALLAATAPAAWAVDAIVGIEQALLAAQQEKRGVTLYVNGQTVAAR